MSTVLPFANNTLATFVYEPFSYTISNPGSYTLTTTNTSGIPPGYLVNNGTDVVFSASSNGMGVGQESFTVTARDGSGNTVATSSNTVNIGAGRFLDASGLSYAGRSFTFYKNEPITALPLVAPFAISSPTSVPTLPPGLTYTSNASNTYSITGTPLVTVPQSNYLVIGKATGSNLGKIVTSQFGMSVSNERVLVNLTGSSIVSPMTVDSAISTRTITAQFPPYPSGGTLRYTWSGLPDGIVVTDLSGNTQSSPFTPSESSYTLNIEGTPTITAANAYRDAGITSNVVTFTATRTNPLPVISNTEAITFRFGETVLFDSVSVPTLYSGVALDSSLTYFRAQTYFGSGSAISTIFSPDLRSDLSINFVPSQGRGYLTGTPIGTGSASYTIRAINSNAVSRDISVPITIAADVVTFQSPTPSPIDTCFNFVLSRPISASLTGYYTSNIRFSATAASGKPVTFSTSSLTGTGLSLSNINSNTVQLVGTPEAVTSLATATITASAVGTPATANTTFKFAILNDDISFSQPTASQLSFIQNRAITPIQLSTTTLSERQVISYSSANLPSGLAISTTGRITGTPLVDTSGTFTVNASTGYMSQNQNYSYNLTPDSVVFLVPQSSYVYLPSSTVNIDIDALTYSGSALSNYTFVGFTPSVGLSIDSSTGVISGTLLSGEPPDPLFSPTPVSYSITANAGLLTGTLPATCTVSNQVVYRSFLLSDSIDGTGNPLLNINDDGTYSTWTNFTQPGGTSLESKNSTIDSNVYLIGTGGPTFHRSTDGVNWAENITFTSYTGENPNTVYTFRYSPDASTWYAAGATYSIATNAYVAGLFTSSDDGLSWSLKSQAKPYPRQLLFGSTSTNYMIRNGVAFGSNSGVLMIGGSISIGDVAVPILQRSTNEGVTWSNVNQGDFNESGAGECCDFELSGTVWVAAGSTKYNLGSVYSSFPDGARTLKYSTDQGDKWFDTTGAGVFSVTATRVVYDGSSNWLATGLNRVNEGSEIWPRVVTALSYSSNGSNWSSITLPSTTFTEFTPTDRMPLPEIADIWKDDSNWYVYVKIEDGSAYPSKILQHSLSGDLTTGWTTKADPVTPFATVANTYVHSLKSNYVRLGQPTTITLGFNSLPSNGPTLTSPTNTSYLFYQYVPITPIEFTATGTGQIYFFVDTTELPVGLAFDPLTATLSGTPVNLGQKSFSIYVKDDVGVTRVIVSTNTIIPTVTRQQTSAGAWTSLIRQYTVVNAAQNSVNGKALPATEPPLGEFMRPQPPDSTSAPGDPNCVKKC